MGPETPRTQLPTADFTVHFVDFAQTETCSGVTLKRQDITNGGVVRGEELTFDVQTKAQVEADGLAVWNIDGRKIRSDKDLNDCPIVSRVEKQNADGTWEEFTSNEYCTVDLPALQLQCSVRQLQFLEDLTPEFAPDFTGYDAQRLEINLRFVHQDQADPSIFVEDPVKIILNSSAEKKSAYCDYSALAITAGTGMTADKKYKIGEGEASGKQERYVITTEIPEIDNLSISCREQLYRTLDYKLPQSDIWIPVSRLDDMTRNEYGIHLESDADFEFITASLTQEEFLNFIEPTFVPTDSKSHIDLRLTWRNSGDEAIDAISEKFTLTVEARSEPVPCAEFRTELRSKTLDTHHYILGQQDRFSIADTLVATSINAATPALVSDECRPKYRFEVYDESAAEWKDWKAFKADIEAKNPNHYFTTEIEFDPATASFGLSTNKADLDVVQANFQDPQSNKTIFKVKVAAY
jgi:hypothetical protein